MKLNRYCLCLYVLFKENADYYIYVSLLIMTVLLNKYNKSLLDSLRRSDVYSCLIYMSYASVLFLAKNTAGMLSAQNAELHGG